MGNKLEIALTRLRDLRWRDRLPSLAQCVNLSALVDDVVIGVDGAYSTVWRLAAMDLSLLDEAALGACESDLQALLNVLPGGATMQFLVRIRRGDEAGISAYEAGGPQRTSRLGRMIVARRAAALRAKFVQRREYYVSFTSRTHGARHPSLPLIPDFKRPLKARMAEFHEHRLREHRLIEQSIGARLEAMGFSPDRLKAQGLLDFLYRHLNPKSPRTLPITRLDPERSLRTQILHHPLREEFDHLYLNDTHVRGISLFSLPEAGMLGKLYDLLYGILPDCDASFSVEALDHESAVETLKLRNNVTRSLASITPAKNYAAEQKAVELDALLAELEASPQRLFDASLNVVVYGAGQEELERKTAMVTAAFHDIGSAKGAADDMNHLRVFLSALPGHEALQDRRFLMPTRAASALVPLLGAWRGHVKPKILLETPSGELVNFDPFASSLDVKHGLVVGSSGAGKSFTTNYILANVLSQSDNACVFVIDVGGSYRKLCRLWGGQYFEVAVDEQFAFNPFPRREDIVADGSFDEDALAFLTLLLSRMCLEGDERLPKEHQAIFDAAIRKAYANKEEVLLIDVQKALAGMQGEDAALPKYVKALSLFTQRYGKLFNRPRRLDTRARLVVFDLQKLDEHPELQNVYFFIIQAAIWRKLYNLSLEKYIVIDEGWKFFDNPVGGKLVQSLYRTARKFNGAVYSITQSPSDLLNSQAGDAIVTNSFQRFILRLKKGHELLEKVGLNTAEIAAVRSLSGVRGKFSDVFIKSDKDAFIARIEPNPLEYWVCTTSSEDLLTERRIRKAHPEWPEIRVLEKLEEESRCA